MLGVAYKADIADMRESPALKLIELLRTAGADVSYHDPHVPELPELGLSSVAARARARTTASRSSPPTPTIDYEEARRRRAQLVVDFRNATGRTAAADEKVWKL